MKRPPDLRALLLGGLLALELVVVGGVSAVVYLRARRESHEALERDLRLRATTLAGLLELGPEGHEFELPEKVLPEYAAPGRGAFAAIYDASGKAVVRSPSLAGADLPAAATGDADEFAFAEIDAGGVPCASVSHSFLVHVEHEEDAGWTPPTGEALRRRIVVAADRRPRDEGLQGLLVFLGATAAGAFVVTALGGLLVVRAVLGPVRRMTAEASALTPQEPSRRLDSAAVPRELEPLATTLNSAFDRLADALERQKRFASDASHELRTPLAVLLGNVEHLLRRERGADEYRRGLERQGRIARRMTRITENLLALARADGGRARVRRERTDLGALVREVCDELESAAAEGGVALSCESVEAPVDGDATYLEVLVQNLVANAVKFTPPGGSVRVRVTDAADDVVLEVADTGSGIAPEHLPRLFERFFRVSDGGDPREGAGLGLAIVDWIVREHEAKIDVRSEPGRGTTFTVRLSRSGVGPPARAGDGARAGPAEPRTAGSVT